MKREELIKKFKESAKHTERLRADPRYKNILGFFIQKGFLNANEKFPRVGNQRIPLKDAIWVGLQVEPRILEVLPAAFARLPKSFNFTLKEADLLKDVVKHLRDDEPTGPDFMGVAYKKLKTWYNLPLRDHRTKTPREKKVACNFRFKPEVIKKLNMRVKAEKISATKVLEKLVLGEY